VVQHFEHEVDDDAAWRDADLVIAADGVNSRARTRHADVFKPDIDALWPLMERMQAAEMAVEEPVSAG
jgi:2-polyprenyl-6-methoxyphenol hydroxylase-like FAD-dependent oxidoreductase